MLKNEAIKIIFMFLQKVKIAPLSGLFAIIVIKVALYIQKVNAVSAPTVKVRVDGG